MDLYSKVQIVARQSTPANLIQNLNYNFPNYTFTIHTIAPDITSVKATGRQGNFVFDVDNSDNLETVLPFPYNSDPESALRPIDMLNGGYSGTLLSNLEVFQISQNPNKKFY